MAPHLLEFRESAELVEALADLHPHEEPALIANVSNRNAEQLLDDLRAADVLVSDFDGTVHPGNQWGDMRQCMLPAHRDADTEEAARYFAGDRTDFGDLCFIYDSANRLIDSKLTWDVLGEHAKACEPRPGAVDLIRSFAPERVAFVSYGIREYIQCWMREHLAIRIFQRGKKPSVFALQLEWRQEFQGFVRGIKYHECIGYLAETVVTEANKGFAGESFRALHRAPPERVLVLGDAPTDAKMMDPTNVGILIIPKVDPQPGRMASRLRALHDLWPRVSAVLVSDSLQPLADLRSV